MWCEDLWNRRRTKWFHTNSWDPLTNLILCNSPNAKSSLFGPTCYVSIYTFCINIRRYFQIYTHEWYNHVVVVSIQKCYLTSTWIPNMNDRLIFIMETPSTWKKWLYIQIGLVPRDRFFLIVHVRFWILLKKGMKYLLLSSDTASIPYGL